MTPEVTLRPVAPADREFLVGVYRSTREQELALTPWDDEHKQAFADMQFTAQSAHYAEYFPDASHDVIEADGEAVGRLYVDRVPDEIRIVDIALLPAARGLGIGGELLRRLLAEADATGRSTRIYVEHNNPARALYERLGFREVERGDVHALMRRPACNRDPR